MSTQNQQYPRWSTQPIPYWLPPVGAGNGLLATAWAPIADLTEREAFVMLDVCARSRIAAFIGPRDGGRPQPEAVVYRVWVDSRHFGAAEDALRHALADVRAVEAARR